MKVRELASLWREHGAHGFVALGFLGILGFVASFGGVVAGLLDIEGYLVCSASSLAAFGTTLAVGYLGGAFEPRRPQLLQAERQLMPCR